MSSLQGKNAIITGGGRGLGKAVALLLAQEGVNIGITGRNEENLKNTVDELQKNGVKATYAVFNVANNPDVQLLTNGILFLAVVKSWWLPVSKSPKDIPITGSEYKPSL